MSSRVAAVVNLFGPVDLTTPFATSSGLVKNFLGGRTFQADPALYRRASPISFVSSNAPTLSFHGTLDYIVPIDQADLLEETLSRLGVPHEYARLEGWPHTLDLAEDLNQYCKFRIEAFLRRYVGPPSIAAGP